MINRSIIITGLKHSGKSTFGLRLASELTVEFVDLDRVIERLYRADGSVGCREIYLEHGKPFFLALESRAAGEAASKLRSAPAVAALGGGTGENDGAMELLAGAGLFVYLLVGEKRLYERIMARGRPAFLPAEAPEVEFHRVYEVRHAIYLRYAQIVLEIDGLDLDEAYSQLHTTLLEHLHVG